jgi:enamine deaminase RidA (YjgF/YER057c/UK114 family)
VGQQRPGVHAAALGDHGAPDLLIENFGDAGRHARSAVAANELPLDIPVEIEIIVEVAPEPAGK